MLVARRDTTSAFATIRELPAFNWVPSDYTDSTAADRNFYFYKIGIMYATGTWWTEDSVGVWVP